MTDQGRIGEALLRLPIQGEPESSNAYRIGFINGALYERKKIIEWLKSDEAKTIKHCSTLHRRLFGQTGDVFAEAIVVKFGAIK